MKQLNYYLALMLLALLAACDTSKTTSELLDEAESGVVLVRNDFYYRLTMPGGDVVYFRNLDDNGELDGLTDDEDEIRQAMNTATGTGFFVDKKGHILTNRHVAEPIIDEAQAKRAFRNTIGNLRDFFRQLSTAYYNSYYDLQQQRQDCFYYVYNQYTYQYDTYADTEKVNEIEGHMEECRLAYNKCQNAIDEMESNMDPAGYQIDVVCKVSIAYNNTYVTQDSDFKPCVVERTSSDENTDLALLCLKNKKTPSDHYIFTTASRRPETGNLIDRLKRKLDSEANDTEVKVGDELHMIGFNKGLMLGQTQQGLTAQITTGHVTQKTNGDRVLYDIPTMQGSSGSPVIDNYGNLVAVNFAKMSLGNNFNFGIPLEKINAFMHWR